MRTQEKRNRDGEGLLQSRGCEGKSRNQAHGNVPEDHGPECRPQTPRPWGVSKRENKEKVATSPPVRVREGREGENPRGGEGKTILNAKSSRAIRGQSRGKGL